MSYMYVRTFTSYDLNVYTVAVVRATFVPDGQVTPASSKWPQLWMSSPLWGQSNREASVPIHMRSSKVIGPVPGPNVARILAVAIVPGGKYPSCLQITFASGTPKKSSQTVPHMLLLHTSTRPSVSEAPPTNCI